MRTLARLACALLLAAVFAEAAHKGARIAPRKSLRSPVRREPVTQWNASQVVRWIETNAQLEVNATAADELGLRGQHLFDDGLSNDTLAALGIATEAQRERFHAAVSDLDARITKNPRSFFEWRAANRRVCDYWLAPLATFSPRTLLLYLRFSEHVSDDADEGQPLTGAFNDFDDEIADNKTASDFVLTTVFVPHYPMFVIARQYRTLGWADSVLQLMALVYLLDDVGICVVILLGGHGQRQRVLRALREELFGVVIAFVGYRFAWAVSPTWAFDAILYLYLGAIFPGLCLRRIYFQVRDVIIEYPGGSDPRALLSNADVNPVVHLFQAPARVAHSIESAVSADWVSSFAGGLVFMLLLLALHIATDFDRDGDIDLADVVASLDLDSDGGVGWGDLVEAMDHDGDDEVHASEAGFAVGQWLTVWGCVAAAVYLATFVIGIQLGEEHVHHVALQMDIKERDIEYDDPRVVLGHGTFGEVYRTRAQPFGGWRGATVAVKQLVGTDASTREAVKAQLRAEAMMLGFMRHPNIVCMYGVCIDAHEPLLLTELLEGGSLHDRLYKTKHRLTHREKRSLVRDVAAGLLYLHSKDVAHLDLKPQNVLLTAAPHVAKLCDFGLTRVTRSSIFKIPKLRPGGTPLYMSPEQHRKAYDITTASDVYSFGIVLNELETQTLPWITELSHPAGDSDDTGGWIVREVKRRTLSGERPTLCKGELVCAIVLACWAAKASDRPTMRDVMYGPKGGAWRGLAIVLYLDLDDDEHTSSAAGLPTADSLFQTHYDAMFAIGRGYRSSSSGARLSAEAHQRVVRKRHSRANFVETSDT